MVRSSLEEVLNFLFLSKKLVSGLLYSGNALLVVEVKASDDLVLSVGSGAREREHETLGDAVSLTVRVVSNGLPLVASENPVAHVVNSCVTGGGSR